jgi:hypothetical protein
MLTVFVLLALAAFICTVASVAWGRVPLWVAVLLLSVIELLRAVRVSFL